MFARFKQQHILLFLTLGILFTSCAVEKGPFASKKYKQLLVDQQHMQDNIRQLKKDTTRQGENLRSLKQEIELQKQTLAQWQDKYKVLSGQYDQQIERSSMQQQQLHKALLEEKQALSQQQQLLAEKEKRLSSLEAKLRRQDSLVVVLNQKVKQALLGFSSDELSVEVKNGKVYVSLSDQLLFKSGSAAVEKKGQDALKQLAQVLQRNPDIQVLIEGHTDNVPIKTAAFKDNWDLSVVRATAIVRILSQDNKLEPSRFTASGKSEYYPVAANDTAQGKAKNRRTEIILIPQLEELYQIINLSKVE
ncbi:OmpA/MotB family protein [Catalinimonas niigatensis]|uniref:OmpA/MotB family protein n=1 Tax=Catalinimonas niigatensis TaxID=1397264 RepID=UPI0026660D10|nr:OmpA family protein [Catalinimonas niigatensis]WPP49390.1 OmpA family protein [Catalinimonas niigatensis]